MTGQQPILEATGETYEQRRNAIASQVEECPADAA